MLDKKIKDLKDLQFKEGQEQLRDIYHGLEDLKKVLINLSVEKLSMLNNSELHFKDLLDAAQTSEMNRLVQEEVKKLEEKNTIQNELMKESMKNLNDLAEKLLKERENK